MDEIKEALNNLKTTWDQDNAATLLVQATRLLRTAAAFYQAFDEPTQKKIRHRVYQQTGNFGKAVMQITDELEEIERKLL